ncbi:hypothetical protein ACTZSO_23335, partial [Klebsiella pneumoniae]|nr:hypothetical protein [Klebsiella pneumoniae]
MVRFIAIFFLTISLCGVAQANDTDSEKVEQIVNRAIDGNERMADACADNWLCKVMIDSTKGKRAARTVLTGMCYSVGSATRQGSSS